MVDYGYRSVTAIPYPLDSNTVSQETLEAIPGIGKKGPLELYQKDL